MAEQEIGKKGKTYGLLLPKKGQNKVKVKSVFGDDSDDESAHDAINTSIKQEAQKSKIKRQTQLEIDRALEADPTVYEYDSIYDSMQEKKAQQVAAISSDKSNVEKKAKYIGGLLKASEVRKREFERQQERKVQKERETEGDEFAEKEVFVTGAYRKKMQEMQEAEEEERRQSQLEAMLDVKKQKDMTGFYRYLLNEKTGENIKTENEKPEVSVKTEEEKNSAKPEDSENIDNSLPKKQYRRRKSSSSSSSRSSSRSRSPENRTRLSPRQQKKASLDSSDDSENDKNTKVSSKEQDKSSTKDSRSISNKQKDSSELDRNSAEKATHIKRDKRKQRTRSSSRSSSSDDDGPSAAKKDKSEERKEVKKETKVDKELTIEEIKARYARRTTKEMIEAARDRYFLRKIERDQTKPYIFRSDE
ncbi:CCDC55 [Mytilus coruscus]|uniref:CCDC55 n=1 Tax=Mytilus coruscus TaxID=42192 RepID=A0A6J8BTF3_MYTCO|nr:CCDC55 [Mytilus coruscus]